MLRNFLLKLTAIGSKNSNYEFSFLEILQSTLDTFVNATETSMEVSGNFLTIFTPSLRLVGGEGLKDFLSGLSRNKIWLKSEELSWNRERSTHFDKLLISPTDSFTIKHNWLIGNEISRGNFLSLCDWVDVVRLMSNRPPSKGMHVPVRFHTAVVLVVTVMYICHSILCCRNINKATFTGTGKPLSDQLTSQQGRSFVHSLSNTFIIRAILGCSVHRKLTCDVITFRIASIDPC